MHITILTAGSRGDVQPYVALGIGLQSAGHQVRLATHAIFKDFVHRYGLEYAPLEGDPQQIVQGAQGQQWLASGQNPLGFVGGFRRLMVPVMAQAMRDAWAACQGTQAVLVSGLGFYAGYSICERLRVPLLQAYLQPIHPTSEFASPLFPVPVRGHWTYNYLTHILGGQLFWQVLRPGVNQARVELLGLQPLSSLGPFLDLERKKWPVAYGFSPAVVPKPQNWGDWLCPTGYWFLDETDWTPPAMLEDFLQSGPAPVYIGFGSMADREPEKMTLLALQALAESGQRGLLMTGWGGFSQSDLPDDVLKISEVPHRWLFPRVAAVVHHGGAGTTAAGLRAGVPSILVPFFGDQFFWGQRVEQLGVGPKPIRRGDLSAERLARAIRMAVDDDRMQARSADLGKRIRSENGVKRAIAHFDEILSIAD